MNRDDAVKALDAALTKMQEGGRYTPEDVDDLERCARDALDLLKAQEAVNPVPAIDDVGGWLCGNCYQSVVGYEELDASGFVPVKFDFCPKCGKAVKWDE